MTAHWGHDLEGGWGPFEMIDMANAAGIEPVMTTFAVGVPPEDMADLSADGGWGGKTTAHARFQPSSANTIGSALHNMGATRRVM